MTIPDIIIAIDGKSSTGKSSFAKILAKELGFLYLDSGAMYRGVTLFAQEEHYISKANIIKPELEEALKGLNLYFGKDGRTYIGDRCIENQIRTMEVSGQVSPIAVVPYIRNFVDDKLHAMASCGRVIMDGRDIGTTVFPNAEIKIFMTASEQVRAQRRYDEMVAKGQYPVFEEVVANLRERDYIDSHRETSPLCRAKDAFILDNSEMTIKEEIEFVKGLIRGKFNLYD